MTYKEAMEYMAAAGKYGIVPGLDNIKRLCAAFGNPQDRLNIIHLAGTNGKGSTGAFIDAILRGAAYSVCRFSSPAVFSYEEQFSCNGQSVSKTDLAGYIEEISEKIDEITAAGFPHATPFEIETMTAFLYARDTSCDYAILETGMGGRSDAVNAIRQSMVSVITSISVDHTRFLGDTLSEIAYEKAGIIKEGGTVITAPQAPEVQRVIETECEKRHARLITADKPRNIRDGVFDYGDMKDVEISLHGIFQPENAALAIETARELGIDEVCIRDGLKSTVWHGRFEIIHENPPIIADGAHNADAAEKLADTIRREYGGKRVNLIIGVLKDKDYDKIAEITAPLADRIYTVSTAGARGLDAETLAETVKKYNRNTTASGLKTAVAECIEDRGAVTVAFGSLSYLAELIRIVKNGTD